MNRIIKFRGKRKDNDEWVYGSYFAIQHNDDRTHFHHFIIAIGTDLSLGTPIEKIQTEVYQETVGQFTGCYDADGNEIYEEDILKISSIEDNSNYIEIVLFNEGSFVVANGIDPEPKSLSEIDTTLRKVVGNNHG